MDGWLVIYRRGDGYEEQDVLGVTVNKDKGNWKKESNSVGNMHGSNLYVVGAGDDTEDGVDMTA